MPSQEIDRNLKEDNEAMEEDNPRAAGLGLEAFSGLGFSSAPLRDTVNERGLLAHCLWEKIMEGAELRREREKKKLAKKKSSQTSKRELDPSAVGSFEKHTKGIGMKLLEKMGYQGGDLGKNKQGIVAPIEAKLRPKNMGMGFNDYKEASQPVLQEPDDRSMPCPSQPSESRPKEKSWSKKAPQKKRVYATNLSDLNDVSMPEFQHNIKLIVESDELHIQKLDRDLRKERETVAALHDEKENLRNSEYNQKQEIDSMEEIMSVLDQISDQSSIGSLTLESLANSFVDLQTRFADEYIIYNLLSIACSYALPLLEYSRGGIHFRTRLME